MFSDRAPDKFQPEPGGAIRVEAPLRHRHAFAITKRCMDIGGAMAILPFIAPLMVILALLIRLDGGKAFYGQQRLGQNGTMFVLWKLRSMVPDAEQRLAECLARDPAARLEWDETQKLRLDPRITPIGRFIRKYSIDELPQFWNVLRGDMSLVGPRPMFDGQQSLYPGTLYCGLRPGLTCIWQVSDRNATSFAGRARLDAEYARSISLRTDVAILRRTIGVLFRGTGC